MLSAGSHDREHSPIVQIETMGRYVLQRLVGPRIEAREVLGSVADRSLLLHEPIDRRSDCVLAQRYTASTIAHKPYGTDTIPPKEDLLADLDFVLASYEALLPVLQG